MATKFRGVRGGTAFGEPLCKTCSHSTYFQGQRISSAAVFCSALGGEHGSKPLAEEAYECSSYNDKRLVPVYQLEQVAWKAWADPSGQIRFINPAEFMFMAQKRAKREQEEYEKLAKKVGM